MTRAKETIPKPSQPKSKEGKDGIKTSRFIDATNNITKRIKRFRKVS